LLTLYILIIRRQPRPTLFPYTTLFRSTTLWQFSDGSLIRSTEGARFWDAAFSPDSQMLAATAGNAVWVWRVADGALLYKLTPQKDRKSTRLNSSHVSISYAVFCFEKKK